MYESADSTMYALPTGFELVRNLGESGSVLMLLVVLFDELVDANVARSYGEF